MASSNELISMAVKVRMLRLGLDQKTLSENSGISPASLQRYLADQRDWKVSTLDKLLAPLKWESLKDLFNAAADEDTASNTLAA